MGAERVDYLSDDEYQQALQQEEYERQQSQKMTEDCIEEIEPIVRRYGYSHVKYCLGAFKPKEGKPEDEDSEEIQF